MDDDMLNHICKLSVVAIGGIRSGADDFIEFTRSSSASELRNYHTMLNILADTALELMKRQNIKPKFKIQSESITRKLVEGE